MNHKLGLLIALVALSLCLGAVNASAAVSEGNKEISLFGALVTTDIENSEETTTLILQVAGGYFLNDNAQIGGSLTQTSIYDGFEAHVRIINGFFKYHINPKDVAVPYVGAQAGMSFVDAAGESDTGLAYGGMAGVKYFVSEDLSVNGEFNLLFSELFDVDATQTTLQVGLSYYF